MPNLPFAGRRARAEQAARAQARLRAMLAGDSSTPWLPSREGLPPTQGLLSTDAMGPLTPDEHPAPPPLLSRLSPAALLGVAAILLVALLAAVALAWRGRARDVGAGLAPPQPPAVAAPASVAPSGTVVVDVAGRVRHPGLVSLPMGSRVADALRAAGGALPGTDLTSLNLARKLVDGEQIVVGVAGAAAPPTATSPGPTNPVDLNTATVEALDELPGVGPVLAQRIVDWRAAHGGFTSVSQLRQVTGIGDSKYADLQPLVRV